MGQAWGVLGRPWSLEIASWLRLGGLLKHFGGVLRPSRCILEGLEDVWRAPKQAQASFEEGLERFLLGFFVFFRGHKPKSKISKNVDFLLVIDIFKGCGHEKRAKLEVGGFEAKKSASKAKNCVLEVKTFDFCDQNSDSRVPTARF